MLGFCMILLFFIYYKSLDWITFLKSVIITTLFFIAANVVIYNYIPYAYDNFFARLMVADISNGRFDIFEIYNNIILDTPSNFLFGFGMQGLFEKLIVEYGVFDVPHNGIQELFVVWGCIGVVIFLRFVYELYINLKVINGSIKPIEFLPFLILFLTIQFGQFITNSTGLLCLSYCYVSCLSNFGDVVREE